MKSRKPRVRFRGVHGPYKPFKDRYFRWKIDHYMGNGLVAVQCDCGYKAVRQLAQLKIGATKSCMLCRIRRQSDWKL